MCLRKKSYPRAALEILGITRRPACGPNLDKTGLASGRVEVILRSRRIFTHSGYGYGIDAALIRQGKPGLSTGKGRSC